MSAHAHMRLLELVARWQEQDAHPAWAAAPEEQRPALAAMAEEVALSLLRLGHRPGPLDLARDRGEREAWERASLRLEHERAQRLAGAFLLPGVDLSDERALRLSRLDAFAARMRAAGGLP